MPELDGAIETKQELRARMRRLRGAIPDRAVRVGPLWAAVLEQCRQVGAGTVLAFVGVGSEPDTAVLVERLVADGVRVALPRVEGDHIVAVLHDPQLALSAGAYGIPEPVGPGIDPATIDAVVVPGLAYTRDGRRLGQGGGFYDRFLPLLRADCLTIGVCFAEQIVDDLATEPHDRIVDVVITDAVAE